MQCVKMTNYLDTRRCRVIYKYTTELLYKIVDNLRHTRARARAPRKKERERESYEILTYCTYQHMIIIIFINLFCCC